MPKLKFKFVNDTAVYNYDQLVSEKPYLLDKIYGVGFTLDLVEHPYRGDEVPVLAIDHNLKLAFNTNFYDPWNDTDKEYIYEDYMALVAALIKQALVENNDA